jgi:hypothetical protein
MLYLSGILPVNSNHAGWLERREIYQFQAYQAMDFVGSYPTIDCRELKKWML